MKKVTLKELLGARIVLMILIAVYYWCWARNSWENYYVSIQNATVIFTILFFCYLASRERKYKREIMYEMAIANLQRWDSISLKIVSVMIIVIAFVSAILRFEISSEIIGYLLIGTVLLISIIRFVLFSYMDSRGA